MLIAQGRERLAKRSFDVRIAIGILRREHGIARVNELVGGVTEVRGVVLCIEPAACEPAFEISAVGAGFIRPPTAVIAAAGAVLVEPASAAIKPILSGIAPRGLIGTRLVGAGQTVLKRQTHIAARLGTEPARRQRRVGIGVPAFSSIAKVVGMASGALLGVANVRTNGRTERCNWTPGPAASPRKRRLAREGRRYGR